MLTIYFSFLLLGILVGVLAGLFGFGGGLVIVPAVAAFITAYKPEFANNSMHIAVATSLFTMFFTSIKTTYSHHKARNIVWDTALKLKVGLIFGTVFGSIIASYFSSKILKVLFIAFLVYTVFKLLRKLLEKPNESLSKISDVKQKVSTKVLSSFGFITGTISVLLGIGGSIIVVPFLRNRNYTLTQSAAIATTITPFIAVIGTISYIVLGYDDINVPQYSLGYVYLPAAISIVIGAFVGASIGVKLSGKIPQEIQNWVYFAFVCLIVIVMTV